MMYLSRIALLFALACSFVLGAPRDADARRRYGSAYQTARKAWRRASRWRCRGPRRRRCLMLKRRRRAAFYRRLDALRARIARVRARRRLRVKRRADVVEMGKHVRVWSSRTGVVHLWRPEGYDRASAGVVIYLHGYTNSADRSWGQFKLPPQFRRSRRNALFIVADGPSRKYHPVTWRSLPALFAAVKRLAGIDVPSGPITVIAHSAGFRTAAAWTRDEQRARLDAALALATGAGADAFVDAMRRVQVYRRTRALLLLDAIYSDWRPYRRWAERDPRRRIVVLAADTWRRSRYFVASLPFGVLRRRRGWPREPAKLTAKERKARALYVRSRYNHSDMIKCGWIVQRLLELVGVPVLGRPTS